MVNRSRSPVSVRVTSTVHRRSAPRPARRGDPVEVADVPLQVVLVDDLVEVVEDLLPRRDRRPAPGLEPVAVGEQVAVGAHARVAVGPPGAAAVVLRVQDDERPVGEPVAQVVRRPDPGDPCADDEDVDVTAVLDLLGVRRVAVRSSS